MRFLHSRVTLFVLVEYFLFLCIFLSIHSSAYSIRSNSPSSINSTTLQNIAIYTPSQKISPHASFNLSFTLDSESEQPVKLVLAPNHDLIIQEPHINFVGNDGARRTEVLSRRSQKVFRGSVYIESGAFQWKKVGWARIHVVRYGDNPLFSGAFSIGGAQYDIKIESERNEDEDPSPAKMVVYRGNDNQAEIPLPMTDITNGWTDPTSLSKRQYTIDRTDFIDSIGDNSGCPSDRQIALIGIATDCTFTASFDSSDDLVQALVSMVNTASELFERSFNVALSFHNLTIQEAGCPSSPSSEEPWNAGCSAGDLDWRLNAFSEWRGTLRDDENAYWTLMTGCSTGTEVGVSWVGQLCSGDMGANVVASAANQWQVFAHESGHTFGAYHDCESTTCSSGGSCCPFSASTCSAGGEYIMNPISTRPQSDFSPCTIGNVCSALGSRRVSTRCLTTNTNTPTITLGECGNGIVEAGEECDCGDDCDDNTCCDGSTCRFRGDAVCDGSSGQGCCHDCQFASRGTVCRAALGECDIEETCPGDSGDCPDDETEDDGEACGDWEGLFCSSGQCTNRDLQCQGQVTGDNSTISSCGNSTCILSCSSPSAWGGDESCSRVGDVLDGTPCDGGLCRGGVCRSTRGSDGDGESWFDRHRTLVIGLSAGIGGFLVLSLLACIFCCCCRRRKPKSMPPVSQAPLPPRPGPGYMAPPPYSARLTRQPPAVQTPYYRYA
ncbi:ADAM family of metalloprotease ADM-A [Aspergillus undulatus]|uniref:ADAM family of metalloprotease ADM-A n=1 Tax=Aspergillus undulatus TaxID=1810928 RepID=UPI003CCD8019